MLWYNYLYENTMFPNKRDTAQHYWESKMLEMQEQEQGNSSPNKKFNLCKMKRVELEAQLPNQAEFDS